MFSTNVNRQPYVEEAIKRLIRTKQMNTHCLNRYRCKLIALYCGTYDNEVDLMILRYPTERYEEIIENFMTKIKFIQNYPIHPVMLLPSSMGHNAFITPPEYILPNHNDPTSRLKPRPIIHYFELKNPAEYIPASTLKWKAAKVVQEYYQWENENIPIDLKNYLSVWFKASKISVNEYQQKLKQIEIERIERNNKFKNQKDCLIL